MFVDTHNEFRAKHGVPPLSYNAEIAAFAENHVQACVFAHSKPRKYGENLAMGYSDIRAAITAWYNEIKDYPFDKPNFYFGTGHFTQVVWKDATKVGCAAKKCNGANGTFGTLYSCNYDHGNMLGAFLENVLPPL
ncbi:CAP domain-containing protein [Kalaharituber pfeilii]|nr:CAP domain-containing protein [Kalaharituber pfeilii]